jgi:hypothetical protein
MIGILRRFGRVLRGGVRCRQDGMEVGGGGKKETHGLMLGVIDWTSCCVSQVHG